MSVTFLTAPELLSMLERVIPHMSDDDTLPVISAVHLESSNGVLYAFATDRYTMAVARVGVVAEGDWTGPIPADNTQAVLQWLKAANTSAIRIKAITDGDFTELILVSADDELRILSTKRSYGNPVNWRTLLRTQLDAESEPISVTGFTTEFLARWQHAGAVLTGWQASTGHALILMNHDASFIGMQMPVRAEETRADLTAKWETALCPVGYVDGQSYRLDVQWTDVDGDPWEYSGNNRYGQPLMRLVGLDDAEVPLSELVAAHSPLQPVRAA
ncbi:phiSA1p31-related protein [Streptomyces sp. NPDC058290]|uniref:phiSA1p31-related protein n=1 Tax=Streptomyces sp. NPDC058290 TaxID=3346426 RepID=UPI0036E19C57